MEQPTVDTGWVLCNRGQEVTLYFMGAGVASATMGPHSYTIVVEQERDDSPFCEIGQNTFQVYDSGEGTAGRLLRGIRYVAGSGLEIASSTFVIGNWKFEEASNGSLTLSAWKNDAWVAKETWTAP
jgi:hypothetical protein